MVIRMSFISIESKLSQVGELKFQSAQLQKGGVSGNKWFSFHFKSKNWKGRNNCQPTYWRTLRSWLTDWLPLNMLMGELLHRITAAKKSKFFCWLTKVWGQTETKAFFPNHPGPNKFGTGAGRTLFFFIPEHVSFLVRCSKNGPQCQGL